MECEPEVLRGDKGLGFSPKGRRVWSMPVNVFFLTEGSPARTGPTTYFDKLQRQKGYGLTIVVPKSLGSPFPRRRLLSSDVTGPRYRGRLDRGKRLDRTGKFRVN